MNNRQTPEGGTRIINLPRYIKEAIPHARHSARCGGVEKLLMNCNGIFSVREEEAT